MSVTFACGEGRTFTDHHEYGPDTNDHAYWVPASDLVPDGGIAESPYNIGDFERGLAMKFNRYAGAVATWMVSLSPFHRDEADAQPHAWLH